ncbi:MAG: di-trans,poly-cis-decaprenylcistransferase [Candidatus Korarchaeota archaeon]|nr:di-trans,poly-cis-decaprenylcistransferase [Candidatus Korarchaeota archaeon]NIU82194.1 di-trans,poly-cis-decaprenylcistransferase [Candidatus Thorarchaeota archaeon]NIW12667.1 di-trans,poly-cis-decaprenylcistransferase [Candidatus Thorarchaeota archaeon]NIW50871.1 di-trans,poly-cis-decaprenylcistransferase [Candidatus Korarchaeota archaeon]
MNISQGLTELKKQGIPHHVAIIPDGNRRYAEKVGTDFYSAYSKGAEKAREVAKWARDVGITYLTFYSLSSENLARRSNKELQFLFRIFEEKFKELIKNEEIHKTETRVHVLGKKESLPQSLQDIIRKIEEETKKYDEYHLTFLIGYSGRDEIIHAAKSLLREGIDPSEVDRKVFSSFLYFGQNGIPDPDMVIRTSGEVRLSNFLLWEVAYSELFFVSPLWPEFSYEDFIRTIKEFKERNMRFGQ